MNPRLTVVTGNPGKRSSFAHLLGEDIAMEDLDTVELQSDSLSEIAQHKAEVAYTILQRPVVVEDGGFFVPSLAGWPGAYTKPFLATVGIEGLLRLAGELPTPAHFRAAVAYADQDGIQVFEGITRHGQLVHPRGGTHPEEWSPLWSVFQPEGSEKTLNEITTQERHLLPTPDTPMMQFGRWWKKRSMGTPIRG